MRGVPTLLLAALLMPPPGAANCSGCHVAGLFAGRDAAELAGTMNSFRSGALPSTVMGRLMKGLSPAEIDGVAAWAAAGKR